MANIFWNGSAGTGFWDTAGNWVGTVVPITGDVTLNNTYQLGTYAVQIRPTYSYALSNLTISGDSSTSLIALVDNGIFSFTSQLKLTNAVLTANTRVNTGLTVGAAAATLLQGNATLNINASFKQGGQFSTSGAGNAVNETAGRFSGAGANFGAATPWSLAMGSTAFFAGQVNGPVNFIFSDATADLLILGISQGNQFNGSISNFRLNNVIDMQSVTYSGGVFSAKLVGAELEIDRNGQSAMTFSGFSFGAGYGIANLAYSTDPVGGTRITVCFARGTKLSTPAGEVEIEALQPGDEVIAIEAGKSFARAIRFIGRRQINLLAHPQAHAVAPVRIRAGALAENLPNRDLIVSPDHAMLLNGVLIPARMLINQMTIYQELDRASVQYLHVELDSHAILLAEGAPTESYLDQGNRNFFENSGGPLVLHPDLHARPSQGETCAPLLLGGPELLAIWSALADRALAIGYAPDVVPTTGEAHLRVFADGAELRPIVRDDRHQHFVLPAGASQLRLVSRRTSPSTLKPWLNDRRQLGVCIHFIAVRSASDSIVIPLDDPALTQGWWAIENGDASTWRWTDGDASLQLPPTGGPAILELWAEAQQAYVLEGVASPRLAA